MRTTFDILFMDILYLLGIVYQKKEKPVHYDKKTVDDQHHNDL